MTNMVGVGHVREEFEKVCAKLSFAQPREYVLND